MSNSGTVTKFVERFTSFSVTSQLNQRFSLCQQNLGITNLNAVNTVLGDFKILSISIRLVHTLAINRCIYRRIIMISETVLRVSKLCGVSIVKRFVRRRLTFPGILQVRISDLCVVLGESLSVLPILERECP